MNAETCATVNPANESMFQARMRTGPMPVLQADGIEVLQLNITRHCNLSCRHCHVRAGPDARDFMNERTLQLCVDCATKHPAISTVDITGGAPELHPRLPWLLGALFSPGRRLLVRSNMVILLDTPFSDFIDLYARHGVELVGSLPDYRAARTDRQRGAGVFDRSIVALRRLNEKGYGVDGSGLILDLVHNAGGAFLPASQQALEKEYRRVLREDFGISFTRLFCLTNFPVGRFHDFLVRTGNYDQYMNALCDAFNPAAVPNAMCRKTISVGCDGSLYDCDFNQALALRTEAVGPTHISEFDYAQLAARRIATGNHCLACMAGAGSSCQGATTH